MTSSKLDARDVFTPEGLLSLSRVALAAVFPCVVSSPWLALATIALAGVSDVLDGYVARRRGGSTPTGAALDPITDKIFATSVMVSMIARGVLPLTSAALLCVRELLELPLLVWLLSVPRARKARAMHLKANILGKLTTLLQFGALVSLLLRLPYVGAWIAATAILGAVAAATYWSGFLHALARHKGAAAGDSTHSGASP